MGLGGSKPSKDEVDYPILAVKTLPHHHPSQGDVVTVRRALLDRVPLEIANIIIEMARYWPRISAKTERLNRVSAGDARDSDHSRCILVTPPIPHLELDEADEGFAVALKTRLVRFHIRSCDQGWGGDAGLSDPYDGSWTWFEAEIYRSCQSRRQYMRQRFEADLMMQPTKTNDELQAHGLTRVASKTWLVQRNYRASPSIRKHEVIWTDDDEAVQEDPVTDGDSVGSGDGQGFSTSLSPGDKIALIARAKYPGWVNNVHGVEVEVYYSL